MEVSDALAVVLGAEGRSVDERLEALQTVAKQAEDASVVRAAMDEQLLVRLVDKQEQADSEDDELQAAKWQAVARVAAVAPVDAEKLATLLDAMVTDRFASLQVRTEMAQAAVSVARAAETSEALFTVSTDAGEGFLDLYKQHYVTLADLKRRRGIVDAMAGAVRSREDAKRLLRSQLIRSVVQAAVDGPELSGSTGEAGLPLVTNAVLLVRCIALQLCDAPDDIDAGDSCNPVIALCELVIRLMLSRVTLAFEEALRMLQTLVETPTCRAELVQSLHLRGALDKALRFAELKPGRLSSDPYLVVLCEQQHAQLCPEIDEVERKRGSSLAGLPIDIDVSTGQPLEEAAALQEAARLKERGNWFFRRGNFPTARAFYRHAVLVLRVTQQQEEQRLEALSDAKKLASCSVGASVQVRRVYGGIHKSQWRDAMVSDVEDAAHIEVLYDEYAQGEEEEEVVSLDRIRLRMYTKTLAAFARLQVHCFMNMGKASAGMHDHESAAEGFSRALELDKAHAGALYYRGVSFMALHDLTRAQSDLWSANQQCRTLLKAKASFSTGQEDEDAFQTQLKATKALQKQVASAYKRLQTLHANNKKTNRKVVKEMMRYLATLPGLQGDL